MENYGRGRFALRLIWALSLYLAVEGAVSTASGQTTMATQLEPLGRTILRSELAVYEESIYFGVAVNGTSERELWRFDGTSSERIAQGFTGSSALSIDDFTEFQGNLYFTAETAVTGRELFRFDGTRVSLAADLNRGAPSGAPSGLTVFQDQLLFSARTDDSFANLWAFDGTAATEVARFGNPRSSIILGAEYEGDFYFSADDGNSGMELWRYQNDSVSHVADIEPGSAGSFPREFTTAGEDLYFRAETSATGQEIWRFDGEEVSLAADVHPGPTWSLPTHLTEHDDTLYFSGSAYRNRSVYSLEGDRILKVAQGGGPLVIDGELYALRGNRSGGEEVIELWQVGTEEDQFYRALGLSPGPFVEFQGQLYFSCQCETSELMTISMPGDADQDGSVSFHDFVTLSRHFGSAGDWSRGDFSGDGRVEFSDFVLQAGNFGIVTPEMRSIALPEPSMPSALGIAVFGWLARRSRRCHRAAA